MAIVTEAMNVRRHVFSRVSNIPIGPVVAVGGDENRDGSKRRKSTENRVGSASFVASLRVMRILFLLESAYSEETMVRKTNGGYKVLSERTGKSLGGPYKTRAEAEKRLRQVEFFKRSKG